MANVYALPSGAQNASGASGVLTAMPLGALDLHISVTAQSGTSPTLDFYLEGQDENGNWYTIYHPAQITTVVPTDIVQSVGPGCQTNIAIPSAFRIRWALGGTTPNYTFSISIESRPIS